MTIKVHQKLLLTGAAGGLGQALRERLKANCEVLRLSDHVNLGPVAAHEEIMLTDLADAQAVNAMVQGVQAIAMAVTYIPARSLWLPGVLLK